MCTRFHLTEEHYLELLRELGVDAPPGYVSRYNIAPSTAIAVVRNASAPTGRAAAMLRWGLTPAWAKSDEPASRLVNARAETLADKPSFRSALRQRRCVIPASGFFEWDRSGRVKQPWLFRRRDGRPFGLAGLWESWRTPDGAAVIESCAMVTTGPNEVMRPIHDRMPVMLTPAQCAAWLDPRADSAEALAPLLQPSPAEAMCAFPVNPCVSSVRAEGPACIEPASPAPGPAGGGQLSLGLE